MKENITKLAVNPLISAVTAVYDDTDAPIREVVKDPKPHLLYIVN